ncbi:TPA: hypothetical protein JBF68_13160 [Legionella pneumophila]|nr:hypothetical protein [Legionella pneumophila]HAU0358271.1 hypothetical protein [Legionella pneumophila]HAU0567707.1 hypothetical protein [Legionella pneumophila]
MNNDRKVSDLVAKVSIGVFLNYFDSELLKEDIILVTEIGVLIKGIRQSDKKSINVDPQSINFDFKPSTLSIDDKRAPIQDEWKLPFFHRVIADCYSYDLKGYFIKYNHNGSKLKLLGGEIVKLPSNAIFYEPTPNDMKDFIHVEQDPLHQDLEYERTINTLRSKIGQLDPYKNPIDYQRLERFMTGRGFLPQNIEKGIEEVFGKKP